MAEGKASIRKRFLDDEPKLSGDPRLDRTVRVSVPAKVAFNLGNMQEVTASILERLGCPECHSGWDIRFDIERQFLVDENLNIRRGLG